MYWCYLIGGIHMRIKILKKYFPALLHRDFALFWCGQCISLIGTWMQTVAQSWLVYQLTGSSFKLGVITTLQFLPMFLFSLPIGALIDRYSKKRILFFVQTMLMILAFILSFLVWFDIANYLNIAVLAFFLGMLNCIDLPVRQSFMVDLASKEHLMNAIALNSTIFNAARIIGPGLSGLAFDYFGPAICFMLNGISFIPVIIAISFISVSGKNNSDSKRRKLFLEIKDAIIYVIQNKIIFYIMIIIAFNNIFISNFNILIPVMTKTVFGGSSKEFGFLMSALGGGALCGALTLAIKSRSGIKPRKIFVTYIGLSISLILVSLQTNYYFALITLIISGWCMTTSLSLSNSTIQLNTLDNMRGRIMSVYSLVVGGTIPFGSMYSGTLTQLFGVSTAMRFSGLLGLVFMSFIYLNSKKDFAK